MRRRATPIVKDIKLIWSVVWEFARKYSKIECDDLFSEACIVYIQAVWTWDPSKSKLSTWAVNNMRQALHNYCKTVNTRTRIMSEFLSTVDKDKINDITPRDILIEKEISQAFLEFIANQPHDVRVICQLVLENPDEYSGMPPKKARGLLVKHLRELGWIWTRIWSALRDVKFLFK